MDEPISEMPAPEEVRAQVERMIASGEFSRSPQLGAFLRFVVEAALEGRSDRLKAYTIGVEVLRRNSKFDPQLDPIVRVEATRLRRTIDRYYAGPGVCDPIRIDVPRGSYVPTFSRTAPVSDASRVSSNLHAAGRRLSVSYLVLAIVGAGFVGVLAIVAAVIYRSGPTPRLAQAGLPNASPPASSSELLPAGNGMPVLLMPPFAVSGTPGPRGPSARSLHDTLSDAFTHFDLVNVLLESKEGSGAGPTRDPHADYLFGGSVEYSEDGSTRLLFRLVDEADGSIVWSRAFDRVPAVDDQSSAEEKIVRELAGTLLQPFGVIYARQRGKALAGIVADPRYLCIIEVIESFRSFDSNEQARGRDCLERLTARDPNFALGFTYLAATDLREFQYGFEKRAGDPPPLERGLGAARRGVELKPESARAYEMLFVILFARRDLAAAFDAANKAVALNKYDMRSLGAYGSRLIASGEIEKGMVLLRRAGDDGTVRPPFEEFFLFLGDYLRNDMNGASFHADQITGDSFQLGLAARALVAAARGDRDAARRALTRLTDLNPAWRDDLRGSLERFFYAPDIIDRLANDLRSAGLVDDR
jgi:tetratricopeptide (TPR) repeat protein